MRGETIDCDWSISYDLKFMTAIVDLVLSSCTSDAIHHSSERCLSPDLFMPGRYK